MDLILAIDCGSTNHKVALFDPELRHLSGCSTPVRYSVRTAERAEFDPEACFQTTVDLTREVCARASVQTRQIKTIALASQAQTFTILDGNDRPVVPFLSWSDKRATAESAIIQRQLGTDFHRHCSFPNPIPQLQLSKLFWYRRVLNRRQLSGAGMRVLSLPAYLAYRLGRVHITDSNLAAMSGAYSLVNRSWWNEALEVVGWEPGAFGDLVHCGQAVDARAVYADLGLSPGLQFVCAGNDQTAGALANDVHKGGLVLTLGTALVAYRFAGTTVGPFNSHGCWGPFPAGGYYELVTRDEGCAALDWAVGQLTSADESRFFELAAAGSFGKSRFFPERMHTERAWSGSSDPSARARAVLDGIGYSLRELLEPGVGRATGCAPGGSGGSICEDSIAVIGGGSASSLWLGILANVLNRPVRRGTGDILLGAAILARSHVNGVSSAVARLPRENRPGEDQTVVHNPDPNLVAAYDQGYSEWKTARTHA